VDMDSTRPEVTAPSTSGVSEKPRLRVCLVKQHTTYDLYTKTGPDLRTIASSSNWRAGPLGLWEAFDCDLRIVYENPDAECQVGKRDWSPFVQGWNVWPEGSVAERAEDVEWGSYDIVICIDVAVPKRIIVRYPQTMWCYYFIEMNIPLRGGPRRGDPYFGYNVFFNHLPAEVLLGRDSRALARMRKERRAVLDFPYYMMSSTTIRKLYGQTRDHDRQGTMMNSHSLDVISSSERDALAMLGPFCSSGSALTDVHHDGLESRYCAVHPRSRHISGVALVEAISAGCLAIAPRALVNGYPELLSPELEYRDFDGLLEVVDRLNTDQELYQRVLAYQRGLVDSRFFFNPMTNLESLYDAFGESEPVPRRQAWSERRDRVVADTINLEAKVRRRSARILGKTRRGTAPWS